MKQIRITKRCYTSTQNVRIVSPGIYSDSNFSKEEISFLEKLNAVKYLPLEKKEEKVELIAAENKENTGISTSLPEEEVVAIAIPDEPIPLPPVRKTTRRKRKTKP